MLFSRMYKNYYPIKSCHDLFLMNDKDRDKLAKWITSFKIKINTEAGIKQSLLNRYFPMLCQLSQKDYDRLKRKLALKNTLCDLEDKAVIQIINTVLYRHKYNTVISFFVYPFLLYEIEENKSE